MTSLLEVKLYDEVCDLRPIENKLVNYEQVDQIEIV